MSSMHSTLVPAWARMIQAFARAGAASTDGVALSVLTPREREVLQLAADGLSSTAIAEALVVSPGTVKTHFPNIYAKLGAELLSNVVDEMA